jgi:hypothetical protein
VLRNDINKWAKEIKAAGITPVRRILCLMSLMVNRYRLAISAECLLALRSLPFHCAVTDVEGQQQTKCIVAKTLLLDHLVGRPMTNSNVVGACTGRSAVGLAPRG